MTSIADLERQLDSFNPDERRAALAELASAAKRGDVRFPQPMPHHNLHCHTFFSYNAWGYSPSRVAWECRKQGLSMAATVDFDVLDAMDEIHAAGDLLDLPTSAGLETRVFVPELADKEINSPGEPGVAYFMGTGFAQLPPKGSAEEKTLRAMRTQADDRNRDMLRRINSFLAEVQTHYEGDVLSLTPRGNATERHMLEALETAAAKTMPDTDKRASWWTHKLGIDAQLVRTMMGDSPKFRDTLRAKLMKRGGVGYVAPDRTTFPDVDAVIAMIRSARALPTIAWLDGASAGEADNGALVSLFQKKGCLVMNIIPDRNWNITDPIQRADKVLKFHDMVRVCREADMPVIVGTEMNKAGQKFVDTFDAPEMAAVAEAFHEGAAFLYGHTLMERALGPGRASDWSKAAYRMAREANAFYMAIGRTRMTPVQALAALRPLPAAHTAADARKALGVA